MLLLLLLLLTLRYELLVLQVAAVVDFDGVAGQLLDGGEQRLATLWHLRRCRLRRRFSVIVAIRMRRCVAAAGMAAAAAKQVVMQLKVGGGGGGGGGVDVADGGGGGAAEHRMVIVCDVVNGRKGFIRLSVGFRHESRYSCSLK